MQDKLARRAKEKVESNTWTRIMADKQEKLAR
jgi:hypothetical protein